MDKSPTRKGARGGNAIATGENSEAIGGNAGASAPCPGGRGGDATATLPGSVIIGGTGGRGGAMEGMPGMDVSDLEATGGDGFYMEGGMGGEAPQLDGRGGRGGQSRCVKHPHMKLPYWDRSMAEPGRGGDGADTLQYLARRLIVEMIKADLSGAKKYFTNETWFDRSDPTEDKINRELMHRKLGWSIKIEDLEYVMIEGRTP